jgi:hypothetical protein
MDGCTIDIAEFRCRAISASATRPIRLPRRSHLELVEQETAWQRRQAQMIRGAITAEDPTVYDIGIAREAQRSGHRGADPQHKAKVLRFENQMPASGEDRRGAESWPGASDGSFDPPPAA